jgi:hypothetical protein
LCVHDAHHGRNSCACKAQITRFPANSCNYVDTQRNKMLHSPTIAAPATSTHAK